MRDFLRRIVSTALFAATFAFAVPSALAQPVPAQPTSEEISSFAVTIDVRKEGDILVSERIDYFFPSERHGI